MSTGARSVARAAGSARWIAVAVLLAFAPGCGSTPDPITACEPGGGLEPICGYWDPEDLVALDDGRWLLVSSFGAGFGEDSPGSLSLYAPADGTRRDLYPADPTHAPDAAFGDTTCPGPPEGPAFGPHGIDVTADQRTLYVVNHAPREAIEVFEITRDEGGAPALVWRGCVPLPEGDMGNDVAAHPDGGFVVSRFMGLGSVTDQLKLLFGGDTGFLLRWTREAGWSQVPDTNASAPNGVAVSPDGATYYTTAWGSQQLIRVAADGSDRREVDLGHRGDNLTWAQDGRLLSAGQKTEVTAVLTCATRKSGTCAVPFSVVAISPDSLETDVVLDHDPARVMGAASVAVDVGDALWIGSFASDRIARMPW